MTEPIDTKYYDKRKNTWEKNSKPIRVGAKTYPSMAQAARELGCSASLISLRLTNGETFRGLELERIKKDET